MQHLSGYYILMVRMNRNEWIVSEASDQASKELDEFNVSMAQIKRKSDDNSNEGRLIWFAAEWRRDFEGDMRPPAPPDTKNVEEIFYHDDHIELHFKKKNYLKTTKK